MSVYQNARVYWEMFGGVNEEGQPDLYVRSLDLDVDVGGYYAHEYPYYQLGIYGRQYLDGPDMDTLYHGDIVAPSAANSEIVCASVHVDDTVTINGLTYTAKAATDISARQFVNTDAAAAAAALAACINDGTHGVPGVVATRSIATLALASDDPIGITSSSSTLAIVVSGGNYWTPLRIRVSVYAPEAKLIRCIVVKVERKSGTFPEPTAAAPTKQYRDQYGESDPPPWGIRIHKASVYGSALGRDVRPHKVLRDILAGRGFTYSGPVATWTPDQLKFSDIPKDRWDALDDVNGMLGWNYACWDGEEVEFSHPKSGTAHVIAASDPRTTWSVEESLDETYNAVRVCYGNKAGKPREVIVHGSTAALHGTMRADTLQAPDSIKSEKAARRFARRYLASHETKQVAGTVSIQGDDGVLDPLLIRPGGTVKMTGPARAISGTHEITRVTLRPLEWTADVEFGTNSKRFDTWLVRLEAGAKSIKRR